MNELHVNLLTPKTLIGQEYGKLILDLLIDIYPDLTPERYGNYEPFRRIFDATNPSEALPLWQETFFWKRRKPQIEGSIALAWGPMRRHGWIAISIDAQRSDIGKLKTFVYTAASMLEADYASVHALAEPDIIMGVRAGTVFCLDPKRNRHSLSITSHHLFKYLPDIYWLNIFGKPYIELFTRDRLLSAPAPLVHDLGANQIAIQLSDSPLDFITKFSEIDAIRQQVKLHLNHNAFFDPYAIAECAYQVPQFALEAG